MTAALLTNAKKPSFLLLVLAAAVVISLSTRFVGAQSAGVTITGVALNHSSAKITYAPVPGARDYRMYDVADPRNVKYAGLVHLTASTNCPGQYCQHHFVTTDGVTPVYPYRVASGATGGPQVIDGPALQIDWNNLGNGAQHGVIVEAVDALGPVPQGSLYTGDYNTPVLKPLPAGAMPGANKGPTNDGNISTNGQGPYTNAPRVIARSEVLVLQADRGYMAIPSKSTATQTFFDTFENSENASIVQTARNDRSLDAFMNLGWMKYTMNAGTARAWDIEYRQADNNNSMAFISGDHFMDMLFDGATDSAGGPGHESFSSMSMSPRQTIDMTGGKILHLTMEVDGHQSQRRWVAFNLSPASDTLQQWHPEGGLPINNTNQGIFLEIKDGGCLLDIYTGSGANNTPIGTAGGAHGSRLWGHSGSSGGGAYQCTESQMYVPKNFTRNGLGMDDKSRYDFFISETRAALFQDGYLIVQSPIPPGTFPWSSVPLRAYYTHYVYHTTNDVMDLKTWQNNGQNNCFPMNAYWFNDPQSGTPAGETVCNIAYPAGYGFRYSDERHWDNMGFETLAPSDAPASDFSSLASLVQPPVIRLPQFGGSATPPAAPGNLRIIR